MTIKEHKRHIAAKSTTVIFPPRPRGHNVSRMSKGGGICTLRDAIPRRRNLSPVAGWDNRHPDFEMDSGNKVHAGVNVSR